MIGRKPAVERFRQMLSGSLHERILRVSGAEKMGKSRLMREYRRIAINEFRAQCALIDLRPQLQKQNHGDVLEAISQQLGSTYFPKYRAVRDKISTQNTVQVRGVTQIFSKLFIRSESDEDVAENQRRRLTEAILEDLQTIPSQLLILLLLDSFEQAEAPVRAWINNQLLTGLSGLPNMYTVVAGRQLPEPHAAWQDIASEYDLPQVGEEDYLKYCTSIGIVPEDSVIKAFHRAFEGKPGLFVEVASKLGRGV